MMEYKVFETVLEDLERLLNDEARNGWMYIDLKFDTLAARIIILIVGRAKLERIG